MTVFANTGNEWLKIDILERLGNKIHTTYNYSTVRVILTRFFYFSDKHCYDNNITVIIMFLTDFSQGGLESTTSCAKHIIEHKRVRKYRSTRSEFLISWIITASVVVRLPSRRSKPDGTTIRYYRDRREIRRRTHILTCLPKYGSYHSFRVYFLNAENIQKVDACFGNQTRDLWYGSPADLPLGYHIAI